MQTKPPDYRLRTRFVIKLGNALHKCGANSDRIERHLLNVTKMLGLHGSFLVTPTIFTFAFWEEDECDQFIHIERVKPGGQNLGKLWEIDRLVESMETGTADPAKGLAALKLITASPPNYSILWNALAWFLIGGTFSMLLSPNPLNSLFAAPIALLLCLVTTFTDRRPSWQQMSMILAAFLAGLTASLIGTIVPECNPTLVILASLIIFIPGLGLTLALSEISSGHLISGCSRLVDAVMILLKLLFGTLTGVAAAGALSPLVGEALITPHIELPTWRVWPTLVIFSLSLGIAFDIPRPKLPWGVLASFIAFGAAKLGESYISINAGMFLGAFAIGLASNLFARITRGPGTILIIHGLFVLVPGSKVYRILKQWVDGNNALPADSAGLALIAFVALVSGLIFSNAFLPPRKSL